MHRYSPVRNQRSKGVKIKHVLRFCFLIAVCCWLIFQIKKSHYKQKDLKSVNTKILSSTNAVDEVIKLGRKDLHPKETDTHEEEEEEDDEEHEIEEEKDDEIDENEQYKFDDEDDTVNESEEKDGQSQSQTAREEHYKADDASSAVTHEHDNKTLNISANISSDHVQNDFDSTLVVEESETSLKSTNMSAVVESQTVLTTKENISGFLKTEDEIEDPDEVQHDTIDSTDFIRLEDLDAFDNSEDTVAE